MKYLLPFLFIFNIQTAFAEDSQTMSAEEISEVSSSMKWSKNCSEFVIGDEYGAWAQAVQRAFSQYQFNHLIEGTSDLKKVCPAYDKLSAEEKVDVWTLVLLAMSHYESTCRSTVEAKGPYGDLYGLLQLHRENEGFYSRICKDGDSLKVDTALTCGLSMLDEQLARTGLLFSRASYWEVLRPQGPSQKMPFIKKAISKYQSCQL